MAGFAYVAKDLTTRMMTSQCLFDCPDQYKKLRIRTGTEPTATIGYGLTTDTTASVSSPAIMYTNNKICYLGTYSTGSSSASGTYPVTIESGYQQIQTGATARTEQRTGDGIIEYEESGTKEYLDHYDTFPAYYSNRAEYVTKVTMYRSSKGGQREGYVATAQDRDNVIKKPFNEKDDPEVPYVTPTVGSYTKGGTISRTKEVGTKYGAGRSATEFVTDDQGASVVHYYTEYCDTYKQTSKSFETVVFGYVASRQVPVYSVTTTYTTRQSETHGVYTVTTGWDYGYEYRYTERTTYSTNSGGQAWTHSNINVI